MIFAFTSLGTKVIILLTMVMVLQINVFMGNLVIEYEVFCLSQVGHQSLLNYIFMILKMKFITGYNL